MRSKHVLASVFPITALVACGGEGGARPSDEPLAIGEDPDPCLATAGLVFQNIVNFEGPNATCDPFIRPSPNQGAQCLYFNYDTIDSPHICAIHDIPNNCMLPNGTKLDDSACVDSSPPVGSMMNNTPIPEGRCGSGTSALHLTGSNLAVCLNPESGRQGWGATLAVQFNLATAGGADHPLDASHFEGVSFWVKNGGVAGTGQAVLAGVQDPYTAQPPSNKNPDGSQAYASYCSTAASGVADAEKCDPFGLAVLFTDKWRFIRVPFARLQQKGFGKPTPTGKIAAAELVGLQFVISAGNWDFWLDDISFYRTAN